MPTSPRVRLATAALALALTGALVACGSSGSDGSEAPSTTKAPATTVTTAPSTTTTTQAGQTTTTLSSEGRDTETSKLDTLTDGVHYGYLAGAEDGKVEGQDVQVIIFDKVDFLDGQAAIDAAKADGVTLDTDYYIRNENQTVRRLAVVPDATITSLKGGTPDQVPSSVLDVANQEHLFKIDVGNVRGVTTVSSIEAVYLP